MPWMETCVMDERTKFIGRILEGENIALLCREFGISRVTGHKIWNLVIDKTATTGSITEVGLLISILIKRPLKLRNSLSD